MMRAAFRFSTSFSIAVAIFVAILAYPSHPAASQIDKVQQLDILILHGQLVDGSGKKPGTADVGIRGDSIVLVGDARKSNLTATRTIDATGLIVAPGFIDPHTHTLGDLSDQNRKSNEAYLMQGVTTVVTGNDGGSVLNVGDTLRKWDEQGIGTNAILLAGFGTIRGRVLGQSDAQPTAEELGQEKALDARSMEYSPA